MSVQVTLNLLVCGQPQMSRFRACRLTDYELVGEEVMSVQAINHQRVGDARGHELAGHVFMSVQILKL